MSGPRQRVGALYVVVMLIIPIIGFPFVHPIVTTARAETLQGGNAPTANGPSALNAPSSAVIDYTTESDIAISYDTGLAGNSHSISLLDSGDNTLDTATSTSGSDTLTLTIAANTVTSSQTLTTSLTAGGTNYGTAEISLRTVDLSSSPTADVPSGMSVTAAGNTQIDVGYDAGTAVAGNDNLRLELWDPNAGQKLSEVTGLESGDVRGVANPTWPAGDYDNGGQVETRLIKNAGNQIASDTETVGESAFIASSSLSYEAGTQPTMNDLAINDNVVSFGEGSMVFFYLHEAGNTQQRDVSEADADGTSEIWANFTVENYTPDMMMGAAEVEQWQTSPSSITTGTNLSILLRPTSTHRYFDWQNPVPFDPEQWPNRAEVATHSLTAGAELTVADIGDSGAIGDLDGARLNTDAQAFTPPSVEDGTLNFDVAGPHCDASTAGNDCDDQPSHVNDDGFYEANIPAAFVQNQWDDADASNIVGTYTTDGSDESLSLTVSEQSNGDLQVRADNIHYSNGTIQLEPDTSSDDGDSGGSSSSPSTATPTATPAPTATPTPVPTATPTAPPTPTATPAPTPTATPEPTPTSTEPPTTTSESGPGFGMLAALAGLLLAIAVGHRRRP